MIIAGAAGFAAYKYLNRSIDECVIFFAGPILAIGFIKPFGLTFREFLFTVFKEEFLSPRVYVNQTDFEYNPNELEELIGEPVRMSEEVWNNPEVNVMEFKHSKEDLKQIIR